MSTWLFSEVASSAAGQTPNDSVWAHALRLFVVVGTNGLVLTSPDGETWTSRTAAAANNWQCVAWSGTLFAAISSDGADRVMTSPDGITWTSRSAAEANTWRDVCWADTLSLFVAVSEDGSNRVMTSPDGITWTSQSAASARTWGEIAWSSELTLLAARSGSGSTVGIMTSPDGITWTSRTTQTVWVHTLRSMVWNATVAKFVSLNFIAGIGNGWGVITSADGITWAASAFPTPGTAAFGVVSADAPGLVLALRAASLLESANGTTWASTTTGFSRTWLTGAWSDDLYVMIAIMAGAANVALLARLVTVTGISPERGTKHGGTVCTLSGFNLDAITTVTFDATAATDVVAASDGLTVTCISPAHAVGAVEVTAS